MSVRALSIGCVVACLACDGNGVTQVVDAPLAFDAGAADAPLAWDAARAFDAPLDAALPLPDAPLDAAQTCGLAPFDCDLIVLDARSCPSVEELCGGLPCGTLAAHLCCYCVTGPSGPRWQGVITDCFSPACDAAVAVDASP
jgi:hypothetical protein